MSLENHTIAKANIFTCTFSCRTRRLTWHEGFIHASEVWIKIGGDKGGGMFKMNVQIVNILPLPNLSTTHVCFSALQLGTVPPTYTQHFTISKTRYIILME